MHCKCWYIIMMTVPLSCLSTYFHVDYWFASIDGGKQGLSSSWGQDRQGRVTDRTVLCRHIGGGYTASGRLIGWEDTLGKGMMKNNHVIDERQNQLARHLPAGKTEHHTTGHRVLCMIVFRHMQATQSYQAKCTWHSEPWWASSPGQRRFVGHLLSQIRVHQGPSEKWRWSKFLMANALAVIPDH